MDYSAKALEKHKEWQGKLETVPVMPVETTEDLSICYTPGVAAPCLEIKEDPRQVWKLTGRSHTIAVISDGSAVLGLGNIGPEAGLPVMEGKCVLFKALGGLDAVPLVLNTQDTDQLVEIIASLEPSFGGINLEDIAAPRCFEVESRLKARMHIPVFHDDQHGTAIVTSAALKNALKVTGKKDPVIVINGAGSAGCAIASLLLKLKMGDVILCNSKGILHKGMNLSSGQLALIDRLNKSKKSGGLKDALEGADVLIGVSAGHVVDKDMIRSMHAGPIVFAMANPVPEIEPEDAKAAGAAIVGTGRSDHPNQINNLLAFPGIFKGALAAGAEEINEEMKEAAVHAIADGIPDDQLSAENIIISALDRSVADRVADAVAAAAQRSGVICHG